MAVRLITRQSAASAAVQGIPELPRIGPQLLEVPGMLEYDQRLQQWWDNFKRNDVFAQNDTDKRIREVKATSADGLSTLTARIETEEIVRASADGALASRASALEASVDTPTTGLLARVSVIESAYVDASGAYAQAISAITAQLASGQSIESAISASVSAEASARATADGYLEGKYTLKVTAGNVVTGMNITSASGAGTDTSEVTFQADRFKIYTSGGGNLPVFDASATAIKLRADVEILGTLTLGQVSGAGTLAAKNSVDLSTGEVTNKSLANVDSSANSKLAGIASGADVTLAAVNGGLTVTGGGITLSAGGAIKGGASDFSTGIGWFLGYEGGQYKFRVGNPAGPRIEWDGGAWTVVSWPGGGGGTYTLKIQSAWNGTGYVACTVNGVGGSDLGGGLFEFASLTMGDYANIAAPASDGAWSFTNWTGDSVSADFILNPASNTTSVLMAGNLTIILS